MIGERQGTQPLSSISQICFVMHSYRSNCDMAVSFAFGEAGVGEPFAFALPLTRGGGRTPRAAAQGGTVGEGDPVRRGRTLNGEHGCVPSSHSEVGGSICGIAIDVGSEADGRAQAGSAARVMGEEVRRTRPPRRIDLSCWCSTCWHGRSEAA